MPLSSSVSASHPGPFAAARQAPDAREPEETQTIERTELPFHLAPARGILNAVVIGTVAWGVILLGAALIRAIFFG